MTKKTIATLAMTLFTAATFSTTSFAQQVRAQIQGQPKAMIQQQGNTQRVLVDPGFQQPSPKLGFQGQIVYGFGMKVVSVNWGSAAKRAGLEAGDIITEINGRKIKSQWDYNQALLSAANYNWGQVNMLVKNVRHSWGYAVPEYVRVHTTLDGYGGQIGPQGQGPVGPAVAARRR